MSISEVCRSAIDALPRSFLALLVLNVVFLGLLLWFLDRQQVARNAVVSQILDSCLHRQTGG